MTTFNLIEKLSVLGDGLFEELKGKSNS